MYSKKFYKNHSHTMFKFHFDVAIKNGFKKKELAELLNINTATLWKYETGRLMIPLHTWLEFCFITDQKPQVYIKK